MAGHVCAGVIGIAAVLLLLIAGGSGGRAPEGGLKDAVGAFLWAVCTPGYVELPLPDVLLFQKTLPFVSHRASVKPVLMAVPTLMTTGTGSHTRLIPARFDTDVSVFRNRGKYRPT